ncbi:hypothetical protein T492DRAFT_835137 [Pavlovales sp. CCMP2436]|nr:hypothetical protein T492DRAFT_835137 [Pavlovales sp. CCMP2436]
MDVPPSVEAELRALRASVQQLREQAAAERSEAQAQSPRPAARRLEGGATAAVHEEVAALQEASESYGRRIEHEKRRIEDLDMQLAEANAQIGEQRAHVGSANARRKGEAVARGLSVLEARLDHAMRKNNDATLANRKMRGAIDTMRLERLNYDRIAAKLRRELNEKRAEMAAISEASKKAYATRDRALVEMQSLQAQSVSEQQSFEAEWRTASNMIDADTKVKSLVGKKRAVTQPGVVVASRSNAARGVEGDEEKVLNTGNKQKVEGWQSKERGATGFGAESYADAFSRIQRPQVIVITILSVLKHRQLTLSVLVEPLNYKTGVRLLEDRGMGGGGKGGRGGTKGALPNGSTTPFTNGSTHPQRPQRCDTPDNFALVGPGGVTEKHEYINNGL